MNRFYAFSQLFLLLSIFALSIGQDGNHKLTLEDIYKNNSFPTRNYRSLRWMEDHIHYSTLENNREKDCSEIIRYNVRSGEREVLVDAEKLVPTNSNNPIQVSDYQWSNDDSLILLFTNTQRVWRHHTRGDYWVLDMNSGKLVQLGRSLKPATLMFAKFSPDRKKVAFVSEHNIYVEDLLSGHILQLTSDGGSRFVNGTFDWVYEEEFDCRDGFR